MPQSLSRILLHVVFSTKQRRPFIRESTRPGLHAYLAGACRSAGSHALRVGGTDDHVHIACVLPRTLTVSDLVEGIKVSSSRWMKTGDAACDDFAWQAGYGAFSLGQSQLKALVRYVDNQEEHHRKLTFKEEFLQLLRRYGLDHDERYLWE
ncbi:MAG: IS200/IS605 family transposase [Candidatus Hydrogenedentes bacterium]|nr:IS200/IS605 family transposase [Candidatus Hydrogenedentota bacterium]